MRRAAQTICRFISVTFFVVLSAFAQSAPSVSFLPASTSNTGSQAYAIAVGDFNGDGKLDVAVSNNSGNNVTVLLGNGDGTFQPAVNYAAGPSPSYSIAAGDFNGDGKTDLAVANSVGNGTVTVLLGNGDGTFQPSVSYAVAEVPTSVAVGDFNGDGKPDLAVANYCASSDCANGAVSVLLGNGDGTFQAAVNYAAGTNSWSIAVADFNGDGKPDLVVANQSASPSDSTIGTASVLLGNGDGTFQTAVNYAVGTSPQSVAVGDFNSDGKLDVAVADRCTTSSSCTNGALSVLLGNGDGTFQPAMNYAVGNTPVSVVVKDFNGDGKPDLAVANNGDSTIGVLLGSGDGTFQNPVNFSAMSPQSEAVGDFNGDGKPDVVAVTYVVGGYQVSALLNNTGGQTTSVSLASSLNPSTFGQSVTFTATVSSSSGMPTGTVTFNEAATTLGTSALNSSGQATFVTSTLSAGTHNITAAYSGDTRYAPSTSAAVAQTVNQAAPTVSFTGAPASAVYQSTFTVTATTNASTTATITASGFCSIAGKTVTMTSGTGTCTLTASWPADTNYIPASATQLTTAVKANSAVAITSHTPNPSLIGQGIIFAFTVSPVAPASSTPTGNVTVSDGTGDTCTATVAGGSCTLVATKAGTKTLTASYAGDSNFSSSISVGVTHQVTDFSISAQPASQTITAGQKATYKITLTPLNGFTGTVGLNCSGAPPAATCTASPTSVALSGASATASVTVATTSGKKGTPKATYTLTLTGIFSTLSHATTVALTVQ